MTVSRLDLSRAQILGHRRRAGALDERLPPGRKSLERAAWAGLQDSMPRAALLSIHARVAGTQPSTWEDPALVQVWGPRYSAYVIAARDVPVFTRGRLPDDARGRQRAVDTAARLHAFLNGRRLSYEQAGRDMGVNPNMLRYAATTGRVLIRWEGARRPMVWAVDPPAMDAADARIELARRHLHVFGPATPAAFAKWAGIGAREAQAAFNGLSAEMTAVRTPIGEAWILTSDEFSFWATPSPAAPARLLPSGDSYFLLHASDRELLVPDADRRPLLWTPRVWPGALLLGGEILGTWRRDQGTVSIGVWRTLTPPERLAVETEAAFLPLPGLQSAIRVKWEG